MLFNEVLHSAHCLHSEAENTLKYTSGFFYELSAGFYVTGYDWKEVEVSIVGMTRNEVESLRQDSHQRKEVIDKRVPKMFRKAFYEFAGVEGSGRFKAFDTNIFGYWSFSLVKPK